VNYKSERAKRWFNQFLFRKKKRPYPGDNGRAIKKDELNVQFVFCFWISNKFLAPAPIG
jgi:hypothetical protein